MIPRPGGSRFFTGLAGLVTVTSRHHIRRPVVRLFKRLKRTRRTMDADRVMDNIRQAFERSGLTLNELGEGLGYDRPTAKKRAWFLLHRTPDPRISTVLSCSQNARCQDRRPGEVMSPRSRRQRLI